MLRNGLLTCLMVSACLVSQARSADRSAIDAAIKKGIDRLFAEQQSDGSWIYGNPNDKEDKERTLGLTSLSVLALHENGILPNDPRLAKSIAYIRRQSGINTNTYSIACATIALCRLNHREDRALVRSLGNRLVHCQQHTGGWNYECPAGGGDNPVPSGGDDTGDLSVTQFATVALWHAQFFGTKTNASFRLLRKRVAWAQTEDGGWNYAGIPDVYLHVKGLGEMGDGKAKDSPSMTAAGIYMWVVTTASEVRNAKEKDRTKKSKGDDEDADAVEKPSAARSTAFFNMIQQAAEKKKRKYHSMSAFSFTEGTDITQFNYKYPFVEAPPVDLFKKDPLKEDAFLQRALKRLGTGASSGNMSAGSSYYLWSLERLGTLLGVNEFGGIDWYAGGADIFLRSQNADGGWGTKDLHPWAYGPDTCFALLFLRRANLSSEATRLLNQNPPEPFAIQGQKKGHKTLAAAVAAAKADDVIEVDGYGPYPIGGFILDKPITIRAREGVDPIFDLQISSAFAFGGANETAHRLITARCKKLTLEGIRFQITPPPKVEGPWACLRFEGETLQVLNCTFSLAGLNKAAGIELQGAKRCLMRNTSFTGFTPALRVISPKRTNVMLADTVIYGPRGMETQGDGDVNIWLLESSAQTVNFLDLSKSAGAVNFVAENNALLADNLIENLGAGQRTWAGFQNLYDLKTWIAKGPGKVTEISALGQWKSYWETAEQKSKEGSAPFLNKREKVINFNHEIQPGDWACDQSLLFSVMTVSSKTQIGANPFTVGAGSSFTYFRHSPDYKGWTNIAPPSERKVDEPKEGG